MTENENSAAANESKMTVSKIGINHVKMARASRCAARCAALAHFSACMRSISRAGSKRQWHGSNERKKKSGGVK
jgi:hypothetical protein